MNKINIFLDDIRTPNSAFNTSKNSIYLKLNWVIVRTYDEFIKAIERYRKNLSIVSFDHDLADEHYDYVGHNSEDWEEYHSDSYHEKTGYDCAKWLCDYCLDNKIPLPEILVHSGNLVGAANIKYYIKNFKKHHPEL